MVIDVDLVLDVIVDRIRSIGDYLKSKDVNSIWHGESEDKLNGRLMELKNLLNDIENIVTNNKDNVFH